MALVEINNSREQDKCYVRSFYIMPHAISKAQIISNLLMETLFFYASQLIIHKSGQR